MCNIGFVKKWVRAETILIIMFRIFRNLRFFCICLLSVKLTYILTRREREKEKVYFSESFKGKKEQNLFVFQDTIIVSLHFSIFHTMSYSQMHEQLTLRRDTINNRVGLNNFFKNQKISYQIYV